MVKDSSGLIVWENSCSIDDNLDINVDYEEQEEPCTVKFLLNVGHTVDDEDINDAPFKLIESSRKTYKSFEIAAKNGKVWLAKDKVRHYLSFSGFPER